MRRRSEKYSSTAVVSLVVVVGIALFYAIFVCGYIPAEGPGQSMRRVCTVSPIADYPGQSSVDG